MSVAAPSSKRVYHNFPGTNGFNYSHDSEWVDIGVDVYQSNTRELEFFWNQQNSNFIFSVMYDQPRE